MDGDGSPPIVGGPDRGAVRGPALAILIGLGVAVLSVLFAALAGPPYLDIAHVNFWLVVFAVGLFAALFATPFAIERSLRASKAQSDERWERALLLWGAVSAVVLALAILIGLAGGFSASSLAGSIGVVAAVEAVLILGTLIVLLLSN